MESELFGHVRGAFTGAVDNRTGRFEAAHTGTVFLDEINSTTAKLQVKLLRVLQEHEFERVGDTQTIRVDTRVIAASNRDLLEEVECGRFREDLYYRLAVVPLRMPALKERREDIPPLARLLLQRSAENAGIPPRSLTPDAIAALQAYDWPGNVRQLRNVMDWLMIMAPGGAGEPLRADMLPPEIGSGAPALLNLEGSSDLMSVPLREARDLFETHYLQAQLTRFGGNISRTASFVGMERSALHRKLKQLGVNPEENL